MDEAQFAHFMETQTKILQMLTKPATGNPPGGDRPTVQVNTALLPNFETFDEKKEDFRNYIKRFRNYVSMKGIKSNDEYCAQLLLNSLGAVHFKVVAALAAPKEPGELKYDELITLLEKHLAPKKNTLVAQHQFLCIYQNEHQSLKDFVTLLRSEIGDCDLSLKCKCNAPITDVFLRAQFIRGLRDNSIREQILQSQLTDFQEIIAKAEALEASKIDSRELSKTQTINTPAVETLNINHQSRKSNWQGHHSPRRHGSKSKGHHSPARRQQSQPRDQIDYRSLGIDGKCLRCGKDNHLSKDCRINPSKLKCNACNNRGHLEKVCIRTLMLKNSKRNQNANQIEVTRIDRFGTNIINVYQTYSTERFYTEVKIEGKQVTFEVDSGSAYSFLPRNQYNQLKLENDILPTNIKFRSYTQNVFKPDGRVNINIKYKNKSIQDELYIVPDDYTALLGRTWIRRLNINLNEIDKNNSNTINLLNEADVIDEIKRTFKDVFEERIGCVPTLKVTLKLREGATPIFHREREIPYALIDRVEKELDNLETSGIISKIDTSDWGSPLVVIPKPDGSVRLCVDYKIGVNDRLVSAHYPIRKIDDIHSSLRNSKYFCRLDLFKAYLHIPVDAKSSEIQTISTHRGTYRFNRLAFGIKTAPSEFNQIIDQILRNVPKTESYFDDIIVHGATLEECKNNLTACLTQLRKFDLHLNKNKCEFFKQRIEFLGHIIENNKITTSPEKTKAINEMPRPKSVDDVRRFLGMVTYYSKFVPNLSSTTAPLRELLQKNCKYYWSATQEAAFINLKQELTSNRVLMPFDPELPLQLACDASPTGVAGVLSHIINKEERPIAFASRSLTQAEKNYSQLDREALAIIFAVDHFFQYLYARPFNLITDNQPLVRILHQSAKLPKMTAARLQRYAAYLSGFEYQIVHKKGELNGNADCLSRAPTESRKMTEASINEEVHEVYLQSIQQISTLKLTSTSIKEETSKDELLNVTIQELKDNAIDSELTLDDGIIFRGERVVIPASLQPLVLQELHRTHIGIVKMKQLARRYVYWKNIDKDIENIVKKCIECGLVRSNPAKAPVHPWEEPDKNWQRIHIDYAGPYQNHHFLVIIDAKSKWAEIEPCAAAPTSASTMEILMDVFARHGFPDVMVSDNATIFTSNQFTAFCEEAGIMQKFSAPGHPATNGLAERNIQTLKQRLATMRNEPASMKSKIREILFRYRATPLANGKTPAENYLQRQIRIKLDALKPTKHKRNSITLPGTRQLAEGERVQARYYSNNKETWKLGRVTKKYGQLHYQIKLDDGYIFKRHIDQLRPTGIQQRKKHVTFETPENQNPVPEAPNLGDLVDFQNEAEPTLRRSRRQRKPPQHLREFI